MINGIRKFFTDSILPNTPTHSGAAPMQKATAALLVEIMVTDGVVDASEELAMIRLLQSHFALSAGECRELIALARAQVAEATSLYQFTELVNEYFSAQDKYELVRQLWVIAYADRELDKYEEATIRKIAELIHVPHSRFIRAKSEAKNAVRN